MKIGILGSAPSSVRLAPYADPAWKFWGCSPGVYPVAPRTDMWFELHRWEPPVLGKADQQKPWFSPEYVGWMARHQCVVMAQKVPEIPNSVPLDVVGLTSRYGHYHFTSSIAWMLAMAIDAIENERRQRQSGDTTQDMIGLWGVDMSANEEYMQQRPGCQFFIQLAFMKGINVYVPPESDLLLPAPLYGISESSHKHIKLTARQRELTERLNNARMRLQAATQEVAFLEGGLDDTNYHLKTWIHEGEAVACNFKDMFAGQSGAMHLQTQDPNVPVQAGSVRFVDHLPGE